MRHTVAFGLNFICFRSAPSSLAMTLQNDSSAAESKLLHCEYAREKIVLQVAGEVDEFGKLAKGIVNDSGSSEAITRAAKKLMSRESYLEKAESDIANSFETVNKQPAQLESIRQHMRTLEETNRITGDIVLFIQEGLRRREKLF